MIIILTLFSVCMLSASEEKKHTSDQTLFLLKNAISGSFEAVNGTTKAAKQLNITKNTYLPFLNIQTNLQCKRFIVLQAILSDCKGETFDIFENPGNPIEVHLFYISYLLKHKLKEELSRILPIIFPTGYEGNPSGFSYPEPSEDNPDSFKPFHEFYTWLAQNDKLTLVVECDDYLIDVVLKTLWKAVAGYQLLGRSQSIAGDKSNSLFHYKMAINALTLANKIGPDAPYTFWQLFQTYTFLGDIKQARTSKEKGNEICLKKFEIGLVSYIQSRTQKTIGSGFNPDSPNDIHAREHLFGMLDLLGADERKDDQKEFLEILVHLAINLKSAEEFKFMKRLEDFSAKENEAIEIIKGFFMSKTLIPEILLRDEKFKYCVSRALIELPNPTLAMQLADSYKLQHIRNEIQSRVSNSNDSSPLDGSDNSDLKVLKERLKSMQKEGILPGDETHDAALKEINEREIKGLLQVRNSQHLTQQEARKSLDNFVPGLVGNGKTQRKGPAACADGGSSPVKELSRDSDDDGFNVRELIKEAERNAKEPLSEAEHANFIRLIARFTEAEGCRIKVSLFDNDLELHAFTFHGEHGHSAMNLSPERREEYKRLCFEQYKLAKK